MKRVVCGTKSAEMLIRPQYLFQIYLNDTLNYLNCYLPAEGLAVFALLTFAVVLVLVRLPRRDSLIVGGMALLRLVVQFSDAPVRLAFATPGVILWIWFLAGSLQRLSVLRFGLTSWHFIANGGRF